MSSFTRLQTYRSSWCSQAQGKSQLLLAHLGFWRGGWSLRSYSAWIHEEPHHVILWKILNVAMSQFHVLQNGFNWHFKGWWWAHVNLLTKILAYMRTWVMITSVITMIHKLYSSLQSLTLLVFLQSETVGSPGSCSTLESFFPQLWGCHLSVIFLSLVPSTFFFFTYLFFFSEHVDLTQGSVLRFLSAKTPFLWVSNVHSPPVSQNPQHSPLSLFLLLSSILFSFFLFVPPVSSSWSPDSVSSCLLCIPI